MKTIWSTLTIFLLQLSSALAAEYQGKSLDGRTFPAKVYSYETGAIYDAQVQFNQNQATIDFPGGGQVTARLQQSVITDPERIEVFGGTGRIHLGSFFSIGLNGARSSDNLSATTPNPLSNFWRISIDSAHLDQVMRAVPIYPTSKTI